MGLYFLKPLIGSETFWRLLPLLMLAAGVYLGVIDRGGRGWPSFLRFKRGLAGAMVAGALIVIAAPFTAADKASAEGIEWKDYSRARLHEAHRSGQPAIVDFTAEWCLPCKELEHKTFQDPTVVSAASDMVALRADATTGGTQEVQRAQEELAVPGYPTVIFMDRCGKEVEALRVLGFVGPEDFQARLKRLNAIAEDDC